uniref:C-Jun-amino-terminal kinase-interacting protein 4-like n=1 Tax=Haplochromis burtoni TaxID=8153 RepID=A0A3Q3C2V2_HAPBU
MEYSERVLCGTGEVEPDPNIVSEEAGKLYSELQTVIEIHGESVVESLVPIFVWVLEGLASCKAQLRDREEEAEREKAEREELLERYHAEKTLRKESQERYLELDDQIEQERRAMRGREKERERRERDLEKKARQQADQLVALEEQKANLSRELSALRNTHNKLALTYRELLEKRKESERDSPLRNADFPSHQVLPEPSVTEKMIKRPHSKSGPPCLEDLMAKKEKQVDRAAKPSTNQFVIDIINSTPELAHFNGCVNARY